MRLAAAAVLLLLGCQPAGANDAGTEDAGASGVHRAPVELMACASAAIGPVGSIAQALARLNALPPPVNAACFVSSLPRPLSVVATSSVLSAQPAVSAQTPRIFVLNPTVVFSVVPEGDAGHLLEFGEYETATRTLKGEIELPVKVPLTADAPFTRVKQFADATSCGVCHRGEGPSASTAGGYVSAAFRPEPGGMVKVAALEGEHAACVDAGTVDDRCTLFHALFDFGTVKQGAFSTSLELFIP